jgi:phospho-N-acetylmuramoyl-pentapeptide-transferase
MLSHLAEFEHIFGPLRLFRYITVRAGLAALTALIVGFVVAPWLFRKLRALNCRQKVRDASVVGVLADLHSGKESTPTMGGLQIYIALVVSVLLWVKLNIYVLVALMVFTGLATLGFVDDFCKVVFKNTAGVSGRMKLAIQAGLTLMAVGLLLLNSESSMFVSQLYVPFMKSPIIAAMPIWFICLFLFFVIAGSSNAINLTDGIDGLAIGCTITVALTFAILSYCAGNAMAAEYLFLNYQPGAGELSIVCMALVGASLAFLWYNAYPAEVFMGDTGSLALGGLIGSIAFMIQQPFTLVIVGGIFVMEAMSVILQVGSFKLRGKRIFKMSPIHHHFELSNWHESKVVIRFWIMSLIFALIGLSTLKLR